jgi:dTMP kinase
MNKILVVEGGDCSGKSTQCELIKKYFNSRKLSFSHFHFPMYGHNEFSDLISRFLRGEFGGIDKVSPYFVANMYAMDRYMFLPELNKAMANNDILLLDRYVFSNIAYQAGKYPLSSKESEKIREWIIDFEFDFLKLPYPDLNLFFDVPTEIIAKRLDGERKGDKEYLQGKQKDIHEEDMVFQERVRQNYINSMDLYPNCKIIPCTIHLNEDYLVLKPEDLFKSQVKPILDNFLFGEQSKW